MGPQCPKCHRADFSFRALLVVHPYPGEFSPALIRCPSCGAELRVTAKSRLASAVVCLGILAGLAVLAAKTGVSLDGGAFVALLVAWVGLYAMAWLYIVRLKPWTPWQYWLPESRVVGYSVYLGLPVALLVALIGLAVHFKWGL
jgi:hypothetical protein